MKKCKVCKEEFKPFNSTNKYCGLDCAKEDNKKAAGKPKASKKAVKKPRKKKAKTVAKLSDDAAKLLQRLVRLRAADSEGYCSCVTCGSTRKWNDGMQGGHFRPRGKAATKLMVENLHPQCEDCNGFGMKYHGAEAIYTMYMIKTYGAEFVEDLIHKSKQAHKWNRLDLEEKIEAWGKEIKELEAITH